MLSKNAPSINDEGIFFLPSTADDICFDEIDGLSEGVLPAGAVAWDQVFKRPLQFGPWPYREDDLNLIRNFVPEITRQKHVIEAVLLAARWFIWKRKQNQLGPSKPNACHDLERLRDLVEKMLTALDTLCIEAKQHLEEHQSLGVSDNSWIARDFSYSAHRFLHDNRFALRNLPAGASDGRPRNDLDEWLTYQFWVAWSEAHDAKPPKRGWPAFRAACCDPLRALGLACRAEKTWQDMLGNALKKRRGNRS